MLMGLSRVDGLEERRLKVGRSRCGRWVVIDDASGD